MGNSQKHKIWHFAITDDTKSDAVANIRQLLKDFQKHERLAILNACENLTRADVNSDMEANNGQ